MTIINFILDHLGIILILAGLAIVALVLWAFWEDKSGVCWEHKTPKPPVCSSKYIPSQHSPQFKTPFQRAAFEKEASEIEKTFQKLSQHALSKTAHHIKKKH